jgi:hypothetical protein
MNRIRRALEIETKGKTEGKAEQKIKADDEFIDHAKVGSRVKQGDVK